MLRSSPAWAVLALLAAVAIARQEFLRQPSSTEVNPGQTAKLECTILSIEGNCVWQKDRMVQHMFDEKYEWNGDYTKGDCSLLIHNASIDIDDGMWICQVTPSSYDAKDDLTSPAVHLTVRERPQLPVFGFDSSHVTAEDNLTVVADQKTTLSCYSRFGNPPAILRWFLGNDDITQYSNQINVTEEENNRLWKASSTLNYSFSKKNNDEILRCLAFHETYEGKANDVAAGLNVHYRPSVNIAGQPTKDVENGKDSLTLECHSDANPPARITWKKDGKELLSGTVVHLSPVFKNHSGRYSCEGRNSLGKSEKATIDINVKYSPENVEVFPSDVNVGVHDHTSLRCTAHSNPPPHFSWLFSENSDPDNAQLRGFNDTLHLKNVTYKDEGMYFCIASNVIHNEERSVQSAEVKVNVFGTPQILQNLPSKIQIEKGEDAVLNVAFCSDPPPSVITWEWGSIKLSVGEGKGKYIADQHRMGNKATDCYEARLIIQKVDPSDSQYYMLTIENGSGNDTCILTLDVSEPVSMPAIIGIIIGCLILLVIVVLVILYAVRSEKWCFHKAAKFREAHILSDGNSIKSSSRPGAIPPDALYTLPTKQFVKAEADKELDPNDENKKNVDEGEMSPDTPNNFHNEYSEMQFRPHIHEIADI